MRATARPDMEGIDPNLIAIMVFIAGLYFVRRDKQDTQHVKSVQVDTELRTQVQAIQAWQAEHATIHKCVTRLSTQMEDHFRQMSSMARDLRDMTQWMMELRAAMPQRSRRFSPYDFDGSDWVREGMPR